MAESNEKNNENMYSLLKTRIDTAMKNASKLHAKQMKLPIKNQNPVTLVYELVQKLS